MKRIKQWVRLLTRGREIARSFDDYNVEIVELLDELRDGIAESVTIHQSNEDAPPNEAIEVNGEWTKWRDRRFEGDNLLLCLQAAVDAKRDVEAGA